MSFTAWLKESTVEAPRRLASALANDSSSAADLAVLLRGALRAETIARGYSWEVDLPVELAEKIAPLLSSAALELKGGAPARVCALPWKPTWHAHADAVDPDAAFLPERRRPGETSCGDPMLNALGMTDYTSVAQRDALRSVLCAEPGETLAMCLPTGSGKSLCAFLPA